MVLRKLFSWLIKSTNWYPLVLWLYCKLQITDNKSISGTYCELILNSSAAFAGGIVRAAVQPQRCIIDGFRVKNCKNGVKTGRMPVRGAVVDADAASCLPWSRGDFLANLRGGRASCAIFTKYMIHRFIKHGKCFVTNFYEKYFFVEG